MDNLLLGVSIGVLITAVGVFAWLVSRAGSLARAVWGLRIAGKVSQDPTLEAKINAAVGTTAAPTKPSPTTKPAPPPKPSGEPLRILTLLQADARLVDFLMEDISAASDKTLGEGVREIHRKAAATLKQHLVIVPIMTGSEGDRVTVPTGFDPSAIRVTGQVTGKPPFTGELQHAGWRVTELKLPNTAAGQDLFVLQPAEVQV